MLAGGGATYHSICYKAMQRQSGLIISGEPYTSQIVKRCGYLPSESNQENKSGLIISGEPYTSPIVKRCRHLPSESNQEKKSGLIISGEPYMSPMLKAVGDFIGALQKALVDPAPPVRQY